MSITATKDDVFAIGGQFNLVDEIDYSVFVNENVEIGGVSEGEYVFLLCLEVERGGDDALQCFCAVDGHRHIFREEHLCVSVGRSE